MAKKRKHSREKKINKNRNSRFTKICSIIIGLWSITTVYIDSSQNGQSLNDQSAVDKIHHLFQNLEADDFPFKFGEFDGTSGLFVDTSGVNEVKIPIDMVISSGIESPFANRLSYNVLTGKIPPFALTILNLIWRRRVFLENDREGLGVFFSTAIPLFNHSTKSPLFTESANVVSTEPGSLESLFALSTSGTSIRGLKPLIEKLFLFLRSSIITSPYLKKHLSTADKSNSNSTLKQKKIFWFDEKYEENEEEEIRRKRGDLGLEPPTIAELQWSFITLINHGLPLSIALDEATDILGFDAQKLVHDDNHKRTLDLNNKANFENLNANPIVDDWDLLFMSDNQTNSKNGNKKNPNRDSHKTEEWWEILMHWTPTDEESCNAVPSLTTSESSNSLANVQESDWKRSDVEFKTESLNILTPDLYTFTAEDIAELSWLLSTLDRSVIVLPFVVAGVFEGVEPTTLYQGIQIPKTAIDSLPPTTVNPYPPKSDKAFYRDLMDAEGSEAIDGHNNNHDSDQSSNYPNLSKFRYLIEVLIRVSVKLKNSLLWLLSYFFDEGQLSWSEYTNQSLHMSLSNDKNESWGLASTQRSGKSIWDESCAPNISSKNSQSAVVDSMIEKEELENTICRNYRNVIEKKNVSATFESSSILNSNFLQNRRHLRDLWLPPTTANHLSPYNYVRLPNVHNLFRSGYKSSTIDSEQNFFSGYQDFWSFDLSPNWIQHPRSAHSETVQDYSQQSKQEIGETITIDTQDLNATKLHSGNIGHNNIETAHDATFLHNVLNNHEDERHSIFGGLTTDDPTFESKGFFSSENETTFYIEDELESKSLQSADDTIVTSNSTIPFPSDEDDLLVSQVKNETINSSDSNNIKIPFESFQKASTNLIHFPKIARLGETEVFLGVEPLTSSNWTSISSQVNKTQNSISVTGGNTNSSSNAIYTPIYNPFDSSHVVTSHKRAGRYRELQFGRIGQSTDGLSLITKGDLLDTHHASVIVAEEIFSLQHLEYLFHGTISTCKWSNAMVKEIKTFNESKVMDSLKHLFKLCSELKNSLFQSNYLSECLYQTPLQMKNLKNHIEERMRDGKYHGNDMEMTWKRGGVFSLSTHPSIAKGSAARVDPLFIKCAHEYIQIEKNIKKINNIDVPTIKQAIAENAFSPDSVESNSKIFNYTNLHLETENEESSTMGLQLVKSTLLEKLRRIVDGVRLVFFKGELDDDSKLLEFPGIRVAESECRLIGDVDRTLRELIEQ